MKKVMLGLFMIASMVFVSCEGENKSNEKTTTTQGQELSEVSFGVRGNCGMCKTTIEKAAKSVAGVSEANWDVNKKRITVAYNENTINEKDIHKAIAAAGYDTEDAKGDKSAYKNLPKCCQYDSEMKMNQ